MKLYSQWVKWAFAGPLSLILFFPLVGQNYHTRVTIDSVSNPPKVTGTSEEDLFDILLPNIMVEGNKYKKLSPNEYDKYWRYIRDVKKVYPMALLLKGTLMETFEYIETLPTEKERKAHLDRVERDLIEEFRPLMKKYTLRQGIMLIKLVDRETGSSGYEIIRSVYGSFAASWYNMIARMYGNNLRSRYDPSKDPEDALIERIIVLMKRGVL